MNEYTIEISKTCLLLSYAKNGKLKGVKAKRGFLNPDVMSDILPSTEQAMLYMVESSKLANKVSKEKDPFFSTAQSKWLSSYKERSGISYRFNSQCGKALKEIGVYLTQECGNTEKALQTWDLLCEKWNSLPDFYRNKPELVFVNSQLNTILNLLKNGQQASQGGTSANADALRRRKS